MDFGFVCAYELGSHSGQGRKEKETLFVHSEDHHRETMAEWKKGKNVKNRTNAEKQKLRQTFKFRLQRL